MFSSLFILFLFLPFCLFAQIEKDTLKQNSYIPSPEEFKKIVKAIEFDRSKGDELIKIAQAHISKKNYPIAIEISKIITQYYPNYLDAWMIAARIHAWEGEYTQSLEILDTIWSYSDKYEPGVILRIDLETWNNHIDTALLFIKQYLTIWPEHIGLNNRKIKLLLALKENNDALRAMQDYLKLKPNDEQVIAMMKELKKNYYFHIISPTFVHYYNGAVQFSEFLNRYDYGIEYIRNRKLNPYTIRVIYSNRYEQSTNSTTFSSMLIEGDYYKHMKKETEYLFMSYGIGLGKNYPLNRIGLEYFGMLSKTWEYSAGLRDIIAYNSAAKTNPNIPLVQNIFIGTGSIAKYLGNYWFQLKGYYVPDQVLSQRIVDFTVRRYFEDRYNFAFVRLGWGEAQDMQYFWNFTTYVPQIGYKAFLGLNKDVSERILIRFEYQRELWQPTIHEAYRNQMLLLGFWWRFNTGIK